MILLIDVGGSQTRVAVAPQQGDLPSPIIFPTDQDFDAGINKIAEAAGVGPFKAVVMGCTGQLSKQGELLKSPNLTGWEDHDLKNVLHERFNAPAFVLNDAQLGAMGEAIAGAGQGSDSLLYMTLGTGMGFARVVGGQPDLTVGSEAGHQYIMLNGKLVEAEDLISGKALFKRLGTHGEDIHDEAVWSECARMAAVPLFNTILHFAPDTVVIGGSLVKEGSLSVEKIAAEVATIGGYLSSLPVIKHATLGDLAGLYGAQAYARTVLS